MDNLEGSIEEESSQHNNNADENVLEETSPEVNILDLCRGFVVEDNTHNNSGSSNKNHDGVTLMNRIFAKQSEDGNWLLRWNIEKRSEADFLALCYEGKISLTLHTYSQCCCCVQVKYLFFNLASFKIERK